MTPRDLAAALLTMVIWGLNFVVVRTAVQEIPPLFLTALRFALVAALVTPFVRLPPARFRAIALLSLTMGIGHFGFMFLGLKGVDAATAAIAIQLGVPFSALLAFLVFGDRPGRVAIGGMALAFGGVVLLAGEPSLDDAWSLAVVVAAGLGWAVSNVIVKGLGPIDPLALNGWMALGSVPLLLALSAVVEEGQVRALAEASWRGWGAVVYTAVGASIVAYTLWYRLIATYPMSRIVPFGLLGPVIGIVAGTVILGEPLSWQKVVGGILTVAGVAIIELMPRRPPEQPKIEKIE